MLAASLVAFTVPNAASAASPIWSSSSLNITGETLTITMGTPLGSPAPLPSSFSVLSAAPGTTTPANTAVTVTSATVSGSTVVLTLERPIETASVTTVSYNAPAVDNTLANNAIQDTAGVDAATFTAKAVTNSSSVPRFISAALAAGGKIVVLTYSESLHTVLPPTSAFTVMNGTSRVNVSAISRGGTTLNLTLDEGFPIGSALKLSYTPPSPDIALTNLAIQDSLGYDAGPIADFDVNAASSAYLRYASSTVAASGKQLTLTMSAAVTAITSPAANFTVTSSGRNIPVNGVSANGTTSVVLTLGLPILSTDTVSITYTEPTYDAALGNLAVQDVNGNDLRTFTTSTGVTNSSTYIRYSSAAVDSTGKILTITFLNQNVSATTAPATAFIVMSGTEQITVNSATASGTTKTVALALARPIPVGAVVTVAYVAPSYDTSTTNFAIQDPTGGDVVGFSAQTVTNGSANIKYTSSAIDGSGRLLTLTLTSTPNVSATTAPASAFTVMVNGVQNTVTNVASTGSTKTVVLTLTNPVPKAVLPANITVAYAAPDYDGATTNAAVQDVNGTDLYSFAATAINTNGSTIPTLSATAPSLNVAGTALTLTMSQNMSATVASGSAFTVLSNNRLIPVTAVAVSTTSVTLTLGNAVGAGETVTVAYNPPMAYDPGTTNLAMQDTNGYDLLAFSATTVTNGSSAPKISSAAVTTTSGDRVVVTMSETLCVTSSCVPPATSAFTVTNNGVSVPVLAIESFSGSTFTVRLNGVVGANQPVVVTYTAPANVVGETNKALQDATTGYDAGSFTYAVPLASNASTVDQTPPLYVSGAVNTAGTGIVLTMNETVGGWEPTAAMLNILVDGVSNPLASVSKTGSTYTFTTTNKIGAGQTVTLAYTAPAINTRTDAYAIQDAAGNDALSFGPVSITNSSTADVTRPTLLSSATSADGTKLLLTFDESLLTTTAAASTFKLYFNGSSTAITPSAVSASGTVVTVSIPATSTAGVGHTVEFTYTAPANSTLTNNAAIQDAVGNDAISIAKTTATNNSTVDRTAPVLQSAEVNATGTAIIMHYNEALYSSTNFSGWYSRAAVSIGGTSRSVTNITFSGSDVILTLASPVVSIGQTAVITSYSPVQNDSNGNIVTTNTAIQDATGNDAANLSNVTVTNNSTVDVVAPVLSSAVVDASGTTLTLTYNEALNATTAPTSSFSVLAGSTSIIPSAVTVSGSTVVLTLPSRVGVSQTVKVTYTAPTANTAATNNAIQDSAGNDAVGLNLATVTNNSNADITAPVYTSASVDSSGTTLTVNYGEALSATTADISAFTIKVGGVTVVPTGLSINVSQLIFTLPDLVQHDIPVTVSYVPPTVDLANTNAAVQDATGNDSVALTNQTVTNNSTVDTLPPSVLSSVVSANGLKLTLTMSEALASAVAAGSAFTVNVAGVPLAVSSVTVVGSTVELTMVSPIEKATAVTVAYSAPTDDPATTNSAVQDLSGKDTASFAATAVTNNSTADLTPPRFTSAVIASSGTTLALTYDEALLLTAGVKPTAGMFTVMKGSTAVTVSSVAVSGSVVTLTLGSTIQWTDPTVTVAYAAPAIDTTAANVAIQDLAGNDAVSLVATDVTNNSAQGPPRITAAVINAGGTSATFTFSEAINSYSTGGLVFTVDGAEIAPSGYNMMAGTSWTVNFSSIITANRLVTLAFTPGTLMDAQGFNMLAFTNFPVTNNSTQIADSVAPVLSAATLDTTGKVLTLAYDEALLASATAAAGAFTVSVGGVSKLVSSAVLNGSNMVLTLAAPIGAGEVATVSYAAPAVSNGWTNTAIQDAAGNDAVSLTNVAVTNNSTAVPDVTAPTLSTAVLDSTGKILTLTYDEALSSTTAPLGAYTVYEDGVSRIVTSVALNGDKVILTLAAAMEALKPITVSYVAPASSTSQTNSAVQDPTGNDAAALTNQVVTNNSIIGPDVVPPAAQSLTATGTQVTIAYGEQLSSTTAPLSAYTVFVGGEQVTPTALTVNGTNVVLTLPSAVISTDRVSVVYTAPTATRDTTNAAVQDVAGNDAVSYNLDNQTGSNTWGFSTQGTGCGFQGGAYVDSARSKLLPNGISYTVGVTGSMLCIDSVAESLSQRGGQAGDFTSTGLVTEPGVRLWTSNNGCVANVLCENRGTLTISFSKPLTNPIISFAGLGGRSNGISWSELELLTPGVTITGLSGTNLNITNGGTYIGPFPGQAPDVNCHGTPYPAVCGSLQINGTVSSVSFKVNQNNYNAGGGDAGNEDAWNLTASISEDFGLAPNVYEQGSVASHAISALRMGSVVTADQTATLYANTNADAVALGTAIPNNADDGVTSWPAISTGNIGQTITVPVSLQGVEQGAYLCGWIDFNRNNTFNAGERACAPSPQAGATSANIVWTIPSDVAPGLTYARLRLSYDPLVFPTSKVGSGEVEDYSLVIAASAESLPVLVNDVSLNAQDVNQTFTPLTNDQFDAAYPVTVSSLKLCGINPLQTAPNCTQTSLVVPDQGTYTVNPSTGVVTFDPLPTFVGTATAVKYQVTDTSPTPQTKSATITPTVIAAPVAAPDTITGPQDQLQSYTPFTNDADATGYDLIKSSLKLCDISPAQSPPGCNATSLTIDGEGTYTVNPATGVVEFDPLPNFTGTATPITYQAKDSLDQVTSSTITPIVIPKPTAAPNTQIGPQGRQQTLNAIAGDSAANGYQLVPATTKLCGPNETAPSCTESIITIAGEGNYVANADGTVSFFPLSNFTGFATPVHYIVEDNLGQAASSTLTPRVIPAPAAEPNRNIGAKGATQTITPLTNDTVASGYALTTTSIKLCDTGETGADCSLTTLTVANEGTYTVNNDGTVSFVPTATFTGTATPVTYAATDSLLQVASSTITPVVVAAVDDTSSGAYDTNQTISPFTNDIIETGHPLGSLTLCGNNPVQTPNNCDKTSVTTADGTYTVNNDGTVTFNPLPEFSGTVTEPVRYQAADDLGNIVNALITPTVAAPNATAPQNDTSSDAYDTNQTISPLANDNPTASFVLNTLKLCGPAQTPNNCDKTSLTVPNEGTYTVNSDGTVTFNPLPTFTGTATPVTYQVRDVLLRTVSATITPTVGMPPVPTADPDTSSDDYDVNQVISPIPNDNPGAVAATFVDSTLRLCALDDPATPTVDESLNCTLGELVIPGQGTYTVNLDGSGNVIGTVTFNPLPTFKGTADPVEYSVQDIFGRAAVSTITPTVVAPPLPTATSESITSNFNVAQTYTPTSNDTAGTLNGKTADIDPLSIKLCGPSQTSPNCTQTTLTVANQGVYTVNSDGSVTFTPDANFFGTATPVSYQAVDILGRPLTSTINPIVRNPPAPEATPESLLFSPEQA